jgi:hypothetical protein
VLKKSLARDVFKAAFGYLLPKEIRQEMDWLYGIKIICLEHYQSIEIKKINTDHSLVTIDVQYQRTFKNVSNSSEKVRLSLGIDEWCRNGHKSKIISFGYLKDHVRKEFFGDKIETKLFENSMSLRFALEGDTSHEIEVKPGEEITCWAEYQEIKSTSDNHVFSFKYPTKNPRVTVKKEVDFNHYIGFATRKTEQIIEEDIGNDTKRFNGLMLPHQHINVKWWLKDNL